MEKTHTLESGDDLFHKPISNDMFEKQSYGNAGLALPTSCLETPSGLIWISCTISVRPWPNRQIAKSPSLVGKVYAPSQTTSRSQSPFHRQ